MARDRYPDSIDVKNPAFQSDKQKEAAKILKKEWPASLVELDEQNDNISRDTFSRVRDRNFGPEDYDITFGEIKDLQEFDGRVRKWIDARDRGRLDENGRLQDKYKETPESDSDFEGDQITQEELEDARYEGFQDGWMAKENQLMRHLDANLYMKVQQAVQEGKKNSE